MGGCDGYQLQQLYSVDSLCRPRATPLALWVRVCRRCAGPTAVLHTRLHSRRLPHLNSAVCTLPLAVLGPHRCWWVDCRTGLVPTLRLCIRGRSAARWCCRLPLWYRLTARLRWWRGWGLDGQMLLGACAQWRRHSRVGGREMLPLPPHGQVRPLPPLFDGGVEGVDPLILSLPPCLDVHADPVLLL